MNAQRRRPRGLYEGRAEHRGYLSFGADRERWRDAVLRITKVAESPAQVVLKLEGRIVSDWIAILERECLNILQEERAVELEVSAVMFVDRQGAAMLKRLASRGVQIVRCSTFLRDLLGEGESDGAS